MPDFIAKQLSALSISIFCPETNKLFLKSRLW